MLNNIKAESYSPAHITSVFLRYRNHPEMALQHLDDVETRVVIKPLIDLSSSQTSQTSQSQLSAIPTSSESSPIIISPPTIIISKLPDFSNFKNNSPEQILLDNNSILMDKPP